jgi:hypothetical protein
MTSPSQSAVEITGRVISRQEMIMQKYDANYHVTLLIELFSNGGDICDFCREAQISRKTFHTWKKEHLAFCEAYEIAHEMAYAWWHDAGKKGLLEMPGCKLNTKLWLSVMKNRFGFTEQRKLYLDGFDEASTLIDKINAIIDYVATGELTAHEAQQLSHLVLAAVKVKDSEEVQAQIAALEERLLDVK